MNLTIWTILACIFGAGVIFFLGVYTGFRIAQRGVEMMIEDAAMKGVLEYRNVRFIPVITGGKKGT